MKAIIFDMDGVIIDSEPLHFELERELLEEFGGKVSKEEHETFVGTTDYHMWDTFKNKFDLEPSIEEFIEMKKKKFVQNIHRVKLIENFHGFLVKVHEEGYAVALASSNNKKAVDSIIENFGLDKYFKVAISGEDVTNGKPNPEIFLKAANKINAEPYECLVIEDSTNGVIAAKAAGMKCVGLKNPSSGNQDLSKADLVIENFNELNIDTMKRLFD